MTNGPAPPARRNHPLTLAAGAGLIFLFGGRAQSDIKNDHWTQHPKTGEWSKVSPAGPRPDPRFGHEAFWDSARGRLIVTLGQQGSTFYNDVWAFDPATVTWREISGSGDRPQTRYGAGGVHDAAGNRFLITHGFTNQGRFDDTWAFDLSADAWSKTATSGPVPLKRCLARSAWDPAGGRLFLYGGQSNDAPFHGDQWALAVSAGAWTELEPAASPGLRNLYGASFHTTIRRWYVVGGNTPQGRVNDAWAFDAAQGTWAPVEVGLNAPSARQGHDLTGAEGTFYLFGGHDGSSELADTWALRIEPA
ncbi:MAG TPA: kelch repeat-containing protein [Dehalococcoidia bacterium]|nr:kelch repeat-containing protein [Dehalococcoidia bacterium]